MGVWFTNAQTKSNGNDSIIMQTFESPHNRLMYNLSTYTSGNL